MKRQLVNVNIELFLRHKLLTNGPQYGTLKSHIFTFNFKPVQSCKSTKCINTIRTNSGLVIMNVIQNIEPIRFIHGTWYPLEEINI